MVFIQLNMVRKYVKKSKDWRLKKKLDELVSQYIRRRDKGICYTCGVKNPWKETDAGHYIKRGCWRLRFNKRNVHCQCKRCNSHLGGNMDKYAINLERDYGKGILQEFNRLKDMPVKKWKIAELEALKKDYQIKLEKLEDDESY